MIYQELNSLDTLITRVQYTINNYKSEIVGDCNWFQKVLGILKKGIPCKVVRYE